MHARALFFPCWMASLMLVQAVPTAILSHHKAAAAVVPWDRFRDELYKIIIQSTNDAETPTNWITIKKGLDAKFTREQWTYYKPDAQKILRQYMSRWEADLAEQPAKQPAKPAKPAGPAGAKLPVGCVIEARWHAGKIRNKAKIVKVNRDGTYDVALTQPKVRLWEKPQGEGDGDGDGVSVFRKKMYICTYVLYVDVDVDVDRI